MSDSLNVVASLVVRDELHRYLAPCIDHLRRFCDQIVVMDDASTDGTAQWLAEQADEQLKVVAQSTSTFYVHEGATRSTLLAATLAERPTHVLAVDADEFVADGITLRTTLQGNPAVNAWTLEMQEVWGTNDDRYLTREDGGWRTHGVLCLWRVAQLGRLSFPNRRLACGRVPSQVRMGPSQVAASALLHVGWLNESERVARHARYTKHDKGRFHAAAHLASIMWPPDQVKLQARAWPESLAPWKDAIVARANTKAAA